MKCECEAELHDVRVEGNPIGDYCPRCNTFYPWGVQVATDG